MKSGRTGNQSSYHRFNPAIPETDLDRSVIGLLGSLPAVEFPRVVLGADDCTAGELFFPQLGCCWGFDTGAIKVIERLSLGNSNVWRMAWTCDGANLDQFDDSNPVGSPGDHHRPWRVDHADGGLFVFPLGIDLTIVGAGAKTLIPPGAMIGRLMFHPKGKRTFTPGDRTYAVALAFTGFDILSGCMEQAERRGLRAPEFIIADVPENRLRLFSERFGFQVIGQFGPMVSVFAPTELVRQRAGENRERGTRLSERLRRETN